MPAKPKTVALPVKTAEPTEDPWYAKGLQFECTQCGNCCTGSPGYVWVQEADWLKIAAYLKMTPEAFTKRYVRQIRGGYSLVESKGYDCVFLTFEKGKAGCSIYPVRPMQCRTWPFWNQNLKNADAWAEASKQCPGMCDKKAPLYDLAHIEKNRTHPDSPS